jgi:hypothetical protein
MKLMIAMPTLGILDTRHVLPSLSALLVEAARTAESVHIGFPCRILPHSAARQQLFAEALREGCTHLLSLDDDMTWPLGTIRALYKTMQDTGAFVVSGHYYQRRFPHLPVWGRMDPGFAPTYVDALPGSPPLCIQTTGLGCALVDLSHMSRIPQPWFGMWHDQGQLVFEDLYFFSKVFQTTDLKVYGDPDVRCGHLGEGGIMVDDAGVDELRRKNIEAQMSPQAPLVQSLFHMQQTLGHQKE